MGIDMEFDKYFIVDANCSSFIDKKGTVKKLRDIDFHRFRSSSCEIPARTSIYRNTLKARSKIEISSTSSTPFTFFDVLDSCCNSDDDDMKRDDVVSSSDGFLEISFDSPDGIRNIESAEQPCLTSEETEDPKLLRFDPPGNCLSETDNSNTSTPNSLSSRFKENGLSGMMMRRKKKNTICRSLLNEFSDASPSKESERKLFSPAHLQGFLKVENKNGLLPSFEFSTNFPEDILVAQTLKTDDISKWAYIFSSFRHPKRRKSRKAGVTPASMLAHMQVSSSPSSTTECVLYDIATKIGNCEGLTNLNPNIEIAAIEIESRNDEKCFSRSGRVNVITAAGRHGLPPSGDSVVGPSSLLDRWRSGGGCDCGGWDMSCSLTVFANPICAYDQHCFQLFVQGVKDDKTPALSIAMIGEGRYSVEFHARLSTLQAFSICIAMLHSTLVVSLPTNKQEQHDKQFLQRDQMKVFAEEEVNRLTAEAAVEDERRRTEMNKRVFVNPTFVINPPFSPIARV